MAQAEIGDLAQRRGQGVETPVGAEPPDSPELLVSGTAGTDEVGLVGVRQPVGVCPGGAEDSVLVDEEGRVARPGERQRLGDRVCAFREGEGVPPPVAGAEDDVVERGQADEQFGSFDRGAADLEVGRAGTADRPGAEQRAADVGRAAALASDDALRRALERRARARNDSRLGEDLSRGRRPGDVELVARRLREGPLPVRADLGVDAQLSQQPEGSPRNGWAGNVEMKRDLALPAQVEAAGRVRERGELGEPVAAPRRRDSRELLPDLLRAPGRAQREAPSGSRGCRGAAPGRGESARSGITLVRIFTLNLRWVVGWGAPNEGVF
jgi:hypothetical protein